MPVFNNIDGEESSTVTFTVAAVELSRNSSAELQEILCLGDPEVASSLGIARVTNTAPASTNAALNVRVVSGPSSVADLTVRPIAPSTYGDGGLFRVAQSTAGDLNVTVAGYSTTVNVSSLAGPVIVRSSAADQLVTVYQSTAADLNVTVAGYSTIAAVSSVAGRVTTMPLSTVWASSAGFHFNSSGAQIVDQGSTVWIVSQLSSLAGRVLVDQNSTVWPVQLPTSQSIQVKNSTSGDLLATVAQASTVWNVQVEKCSSLSTGHVTVDTGSIRVMQSTYGDLTATVHNSTIGDLLASVQQNSTVWQVQAKIQDSSGVGFIGTVTRPTTGVQGLAVRTVLNDLQSTCFSTQGNNSTSNTVVSSVAGQRIKVFAYSIMSTVEAINTLSFYSSAASALWQLQMQSVSSGISGANLAVSPPAWLFATAAQEPLVFKVTGTTGTYHLSFSYFVEA